MKMDLKVNGKQHKLSLDPEMPLLWALRDHLKLKCTKFGCGIGAGGACTVHVDGASIRACQTTLAEVNGSEVTTFEGLEGDVARLLVDAWRELDVGQCGYCQYGQIMSAAALLSFEPDPKPQEIIDHMDGNICRCGTYQRIRKAVQMTADRLKEV